MCCATAKGVMHHKVEAIQRRNVIAYDVALYHIAEVLAYFLNGDFALYNVVVFRLPGENTDVTRVALIAGASVRNLKKIYLQLISPPRYDL